MTTGTEGIGLVVFDCDGTLVDSAGHIADTMADCFLAAGIAAPTPAEVARIIGLSLPIAIGRLLPHLDDVACHDLARGYRDAYRRRLAAGLMGDERLFDGVDAALKRLDGAGYVLGMATGKSIRGVERTVARFGFERLFVTIQTADTHPSKPHPAMMLAAMDETGADPARSVLIGDTSYDMEMARAAGARAIGVAWGCHAHQDLLDAGADLVVTAAAELDAAIATLIGAPLAPERRIGA
ncbi:HAD-IA family hydrolase [Tistrella mobilis]|uniref:HAD-IA family hydrolase n=1 Tax=Tistrella mobilis TaxID=171437 RepID=UPI0009EF0D6B|nr:HAD-IA family hydrolase [Tistrella mobilis]